jgi:O-antigen ligase
MNPIEQVMSKRRIHFKVALAVAVLVLVLWLSGAAVASLWMTPLIIFVLWIAVQLGLRNRHRAA